MGYELRPPRASSELSSTAKALVDNYYKLFGEYPDPALIDRWAREVVLRYQEQYVKGYVEGYNSQDLLKFGSIVAEQLPKAPSVKNSEKQIRL